MPQQTKQKAQGRGCSSAVRKTSRRWAFRGISQAARDLRVSRPHLWRVLRGERVGPELLKRFNALMELRAGGKSGSRLEA